MSCVWRRFRKLNINTIKKFLYWYTKEFGLLLPLLLVQIIVYNIVYIMLRDKYIRKRTDNKLAFTSLYYNGNARVVFEKLTENSTRKYDCYWIARNFFTFRFLRKLGKKVICVYFPLLYIKHFLEFRVLVTNDATFNIFFPITRPKIIQLWHGVAIKGHKRVKEDYENVDVWCVSSEYVKKRHVELYNAPIEKIRVTGYATMDRLHDYLKDSSIKDRFCKKWGIPKHWTILLYAPTWETGIWPWKGLKSLIDLCNFCEKHNIFIILRPHPLIKIHRKLKFLEKKLKNLAILDVKKIPDVTELLAISDILLTDWSSLYTEFLLTKRPIIFIEVKKEYFCTSKGRGRGIVPLGYRPGFIVNNESDLKEKLKIALYTRNPFEKDQEKILKILHGRVDGNASNRVIEIIDELIR